MWSEDNHYMKQLPEACKTVPSTAFGRAAGISISAWASTTLNKRTNNIGDPRPIVSIEWLTFHFRTGPKLAGQLSFQGGHKQCFTRTWVRFLGRSYLHATWHTPCSNVISSFAPQCCAMRDRFKQSQHLLVPAAMWYMRPVRTHIGCYSPYRWAFFLHVSNCKIGLYTSSVTAFCKNVQYPPDMATMNASEFYYSQISAHN